MTAPDTVNPSDVAMIRSYARDIGTKYHNHGGASRRSRLWTEENVDEAIQTERFRDDSLYVWQRTEAEAEQRRLVAFAGHLAMDDPHHLLHRCTEDGAFGAHVARTPDGLLVSRDLLDSIAEIYALDQKVGLLGRSRWRILDIGAGYGRLAHRMVEAGVDLESYLCLDGVPLSTAICRFYLDHRQLPAVVRAASLTEIDFENPPPADLAVAVHSISEMPLAAVDAWIELAARAGVRHVVVVPNDPDRLQSTEADGRHEPLAPVLARHGFELESDEPMLQGADPWLAPSDHRGVPDRLLVFRHALRPPNAAVTAPTTAGVADRGPGNGSTAWRQPGQIRS